MSEQRWRYRNYSMTGAFLGWSTVPEASLQGEASVGYLHQDDVKALTAQLEAMREERDSLQVYCDDLLIVADMAVRMDERAATLASIRKKYALEARQGAT